MLTSVSTLLSFSCMHVKMSQVKSNDTIKLGWTLQAQRSLAWCGCCTVNLLCRTLSWFSTECTPASLSSVVLSSGFRLTVSSSCCSSHLLPPFSSPPAFLHCPPLLFTLNDYFSRSVPSSSSSLRLSLSLALFSLLPIPLSPSSSVSQTILILHSLNLPICFFNNFHCQLL